MITTPDDAIDTQPAQPANETPAPDVTTHAKLRWLQRSKTIELRLKEAWRQGYYVGCDEYNGQARLHSPGGVVLIEKDGVITTVLETATISYNADHLVECRECDNEYKPDPNDRTCPWCPSGQREVGR